MTPGSESVRAPAWSSSTQRWVMNGRASRGGSREGWVSESSAKTSPTLPRRSEPKTLARQGQHDAFPARVRPTVDTAIPDHHAGHTRILALPGLELDPALAKARSEERRVGKECRAWWWPGQPK